MARRQDLLSRLFLLLASLAPAAVPCAAAPPSLHATLGNGANEATFVAESGAPRMIALTLRNASQWHNRAAETLPTQVTTRGAVVPVAWRFARGASHANAHEIDFVYFASPVHLRLDWRWQARGGNGPIEHSIEIRNFSKDTVELPLLASIRLDLSVPAEVALTRFWVEKGGDHPSDRGTHLDALRDGDLWAGTSSTYARPIAGAEPEMIPYVLVQRSDQDQSGWYLGIEFSGRTRIELRRTSDSVRGDAGLDSAPGPYRTRLPSGKTFATPIVFLGATAGGADATGNRLRRWVRAALNDRRVVADKSYPLLVSNSWGSGLKVDEALARRMIDAGRSLGLELYHLDAGWFRGVGDWQADRSKFPHGIAAVADYAHRAGMRFGLWVDWTQAGVADAPGALRIADPRMRDWLVADPPTTWRQREPFKGITADLGVPAAHAWAARETERLVTENHLDMLEHDGYLVAQGSSRSGHPAMPPDPGTLRVYEDSGYLWADGSNDTDVSDHATRAYYAIQDGLHARHPRLLLEICNDGGRMVDFGSAAHGDYFSMTDHYDPLSNRRAFYDASFVLPPAMLEAYVERWATQSLATFRYMLRSGMMGWFSLMDDPTRWSEAQRAAARAEFALYKTQLRPLIRAADLYHVSARPDGEHWDGVEYYSPGSARGVLFAFRGTTLDEPSHRFRLAGLDPVKRYRVTFHDRGPAADQVQTGAALMSNGILVSLDEPQDSELVFMSVVP